MRTTVVAPGFCFQPTDEEILHDFLGRRVAGQPFPISIPTLDVYSIPPQALVPATFHGADGNIYCFAHTCRCSERRGGRFKRAVGHAGTWTCNRASKIAADSGLVVGYRKSLSFQAPAAADGGRKRESTGWVMDEYRLAEGRFASPEIQDLVLCKIRNGKEDALVVAAPGDGTMEQENATMGEGLMLEGEMKAMTPPKGFHFDPSDRELVCYYLRRKMEGQPLPFVIPTLEVYDAAP